MANMESKNLIVNLSFDTASVLYDVETKMLYAGKDKSMTLKNPEIFYKLPSTLNFSEVKAIIFTILETNLSTDTERYNFRLKCRAFCQRYGVFCYFSNSYQIFPYAAFSQTKTMVNEGEEILVVKLVENGTPPLYYYLKRSKNGYYRIIKMDGSPCVPFTPSWKKDILKSHTPAAIILIQDTYDTSYNLDATTKMKKLFRGENFKIYLPSDSSYIVTTNAAIVQHLMGEKKNEFHVKNFCVPKIEVRLDGNVLIKSSYTDIVPFEKSVVIDVNPKKSVSLYCSYVQYATYVPVKPLDCVKDIKLSTFKCMKVKVTLKIDINSFYDLKVELIEEEK